MLVFASAGEAWAAATATVDFQKEVRPLLEKYCIECHGNGKKKGGVTLDQFSSVETALKDQKTWELVLENVRGSVMPPDDFEKQPSLEERERLMGWINKVVLATDASNPDPGRVTLRRLNRVEYNNTIRDLVGVKFEAGADFPADDSGYGFDNIGDVLTVPPVLFERYLAAAEKVMSTAILNDHKPRAQRTEVDLMKIAGGPDRGNTGTARRIDARESTVEVELTPAGQYAVEIEATAPKVGAEATRMEFKLNGKSIMLPAFDDKRGGTMTIKGSLRVEKPGKQMLTMRLLNPLEKPEMKNGKPVERRIVLKRMELISPPLPAKPPETQVRIFAAGRGQPTLDTAARAIINNFAARAFRRPLAANELDRFMWIFATAQKKGGNFEQSVQTALTAVLVSPHFLFRGELQPEPDNPKAVHPVNEWALASRLSYFLWSTMPDPELFAQAQAGTLRKNLDAQVRRMIRDRRSFALVENFAGQWLQIRNLAHVQPDARTFDQWDRSLAKDMERETELLIECVMHEDRPVTDLIAADFTFVNERLARLYGIAGVEGEAFTRVKTPPNRPGGVLGHGSFLTLTSNPTRTSPVKRGKYVLENILGTPPPPAPPDVPDLNDAKRAELSGTLRQRLEQHRKDAICSGCHARMDPIGFGLENFDGIGAWRDIDGETRVDPSGVLVSGEKFNGPVELQKILVEKKRTEFLRCLTEKMLTYALGRGLDYYDRPTVEGIVKNVEKGGGKFSTLVLEVTKSVPFQKRRGEGDHRAFQGGVAAR